MKPESAMSPAGRGRPAPSPSAYVITAPCEKPPSTVRSGGISGLGGEVVEPARRERERLGERAGIRVADLLDGVPVRAAGRKVQWAARRHAEHSSLGVEQIEQREEVALVGAAAVEEDEQPFRVGGRRSGQVAERVRGHVPRTVPSDLPEGMFRSRDEALELDLVPAVHEVGVRAEATRRDLRAERHGRVEDDEDDLRHRDRMRRGAQTAREYFRCCL